jgi:RND family efflux transporter MFP subunit
MKRFHWPAFCVSVILIAMANPVFAAPMIDVSAQKAVTASAVVVPAQVSQLGFVIPGIARQVAVKEGDAVTAGQTLIVLDTPELEFAIAGAQAGLRAAQAQAEIRTSEIFRRYKINYTTFQIKKYWVSVPHEVIEMEDAKIQKAQVSIEIAQARLAQGTLIAPHDGTIASIDVLPGEFIQSDQTVVTLATLDNLQLETTDLGERDISNVHIGDAVSIFIEALDQTIEGKVTSISPLAGTVGGDVVFKVTIALDEQPNGLLWGMTAEVTIQGGE